MKICESCKKMFFPDKFHPNQKCCSKKCYDKQYNKNHKEEKKQYLKQWYKTHKEGRKQHTKQYSKQYRETHKEEKKQYDKFHRKEINQQVRKRYHKNPKIRLHNSFRTRIKRSLKKRGGSKNGYPWEKIVGYTTQDIIKHLERQFKAGMNWHNYGKWHVDHIKPVALFNFTSYEDDEFQECWALENLQPLWAIENLRKGTKILY